MPTRTTGGRLSRQRHFLKLVVVASCGTAMSFNSCTRQQRLISLPTTLLRHSCQLIKRLQRGRGMIFRVITTRFSTSASMVHTKASPSGARAVTSGSCIYQRRCHSGRTLSNSLTGHSASKKSTEIRTLRIAKQFGMLTISFLLQVCPCSIVSFPILICDGRG